MVAMLRCREIGCEDTLTLSLGSLAEELSSAVHLHASSAEGFAYEVDCYGNSVAGLAFGRFLTNYLDRNSGSRMGCSSIVAPAAVSS